MSLSREAAFTISVRREKAIIAGGTARDLREPYTVSQKKQPRATGNAAGAEKHKTGESVKLEMLEKVILTGYLLAGSWCDIRKRAVPLLLLSLGGVLAAADLLFRGWESGRVAALLPGILLILLSRATRGIGAADGIVLCCVGFISRSKSILFIFGISLIYIFFYSMILFIRKRNHDIQIPYLPFLLAAYIMVWIL